MITNTLGLWFDRKRGMAIAGAERRQLGGIIGVPMLVGAIRRFRLPGAMIAAAIAMVVVMVAVIVMFVGRPPLHPSAAVAALSADAPSATRVRAQAFRDIGFLSVSAAFALVLFAQVGFIVHLIAFLDTVIGPGARGVRRRADDRDGGGRPRAVLLRDRPARPRFASAISSAARPSRSSSSSTCATISTDRGLRDYASPSAI